ncbi:MAG: DUF1631 family protein [Thermomonas sp.]|nr:DUF1631 family protein [Thermomonas sp.]
MTLPRRVRRALENQLQTANADLNRQLQVVLQETGLELGRQAEHASDHNVQASLFESIRKLRGAEAGFSDQFARSLEATLAALRAPRVSRRLEELALPAQGLSLVEDVEMDEGAVLGSIAARGDSRNSLALQLMGYRFGVLAGGPAFDAEHLPLGPHALCHALRSACDWLMLSMDARLLLYRQFEKVAMAHYPALLETLNARLVGDGILPHLSFVPVRMRAATPGIGRGSESAAAVATRSAPTPPAAAAADASPPPASIPTVDGAGAPRTADAPRESAFATLQGLLARRRKLLAKLRPGGAEERVREPLSRDEVLASLRRLRGNGGKHGNLADIRQTLLAQARQMHGHGVTLTDADGDGFELFSLFLAQLQRELRAGSPGHALVDSLKLPLLQLALRDHRFFTDAAHPARMLLDAVSLAGARWLGEDDLDPQWLGLLQRAVGTVHEDPEAGNDTFVAANHALQGGLQAAARKNEMSERRQVEAARGREKLGLARQRATNEIQRLVAGRPLPRFHLILLEQAWADVLSLALLRGGEDSDGWRDLREATAAIVEASATPIQSTRDPAFVAKLQDALGQVGYHAEDAGAIARQLANGRTEDADLASRTELIVQLRARARLGEENVARTAVAQAPHNPAEQAAHATLAIHADGCWVDLFDPADDSVVRRRLAWLSPRSGQALLLNRRGLRVAGDESLDGLARKLANSRLQLVESDIHPAELAWQATMANLSRIAGDATQETAHGR